MATPAGAIWRLAVKNWPEIVKNGPKVVAAVGVLSQYLKDHPDIPTWLRARLTAVPDRVIAEQKKHGEAAKIRGNLGIVRDVARDAEKAAGSPVQESTYVARADGIERGVRLAEALTRSEQKAALAQLRTRTDALLAELIDAVAQVDPAVQVQVEAAGADADADQEQPPA